MRRLVQPRVLAGAGLAWFLLVSVLFAGWLPFFVAGVVLLVVGAVLLLGSRRRGGTLALVAAVVCLATTLAWPVAQGIAHHRAETPGAPSAPATASPTGSASLVARPTETPPMQSPPTGATSPTTDRSQIASSVPTEVVTDYCPGNDYSGSDRDGTCGTPPVTTAPGQPPATTSAPPPTDQPAPPTTPSPPTTEPAPPPTATAPTAPDALPSASTSPA